MEWRSIKPSTYPNQPTSYCIQHQDLHSTNVYTHFVFAVCWNQPPHECIRPRAQKHTLPQTSTTRTHAHIHVHHTMKIEKNGASFSLTECVCGMCKLNKMTSPNISWYLMSVSVLELERDYLTVKSIILNSTIWRIHQNKNLIDFFMLVWKLCIQR